MRILRVFAVPVLLCGCCAFCVTDMGDRLDAFTADPKAFAIIRF